MTQIDAIDGPAGDAKLVVDQDTGGFLVELDLVGLLDGEKGELVELGLGRRLGRGLGGLQRGLGFAQARFGLGRVSLPELALVAQGVGRGGGRQPRGLGVLVS